jgi:hypothetical protein
MLVSSDQQIDGQDHLLEKKIEVSRASDLDFVFSAFSLVKMVSFCIIVHQICNWK